jgi:ABC-type nitrate/sulfonate/bicarbonate transport system ATPase subunit
MIEKMIEIEELFFSYDGEEQILDGVNLSIEKGEKIAFMGGSGKGKSTLLKLISSYERISKPDKMRKNSIKIQSRDILYGCPDEVISYLPQAAYKALFPWKTVRENIYYPLNLRYNGLPDLSGLSKKVRAVINHLLDIENKYFFKEDKNEIKEQLQTKFGIESSSLMRDIFFCSECIWEFNLENILDSYPPILSGGEQKRLSVIMALSVHPEIVILDEPFAGLDFKTTEQLWRFLKRYFAENNTTVLLVTHSVDEAAVMADKVFFLNKDRKIIPLHDADFNRYAEKLSADEKSLLDNPGELLLHTAFNEYRKKIREGYEKECV